MPETLSLKNESGVYLFRVYLFRVFFCAFGAPYQKPTALLTNIGLFAELSDMYRPCTCVRPHAVRLEWKLTTAAAEYPPKFAEAAAEVGRRALAERLSSQKGATPLVASQADVRSSRNQYALVSTPCVTGHLGGGLPGHLTSVGSDPDPFGHCQSVPTAVGDVLAAQQQYPQPLERKRRQRPGVGGRAFFLCLVRFTPRAVGFCE